MRKELPNGIPLDVDTQFQAIAKDICNGKLPPPSWLVTEALPSICYILQGNVKKESMIPSREQRMYKFVEVEKTARKILEALQDKDFFPWLLNDVSERLPYEHEMQEGLIALVNRCKEKAKELPKNKGGKKLRAEIDNTPSGTELCALAVHLLWKEIHNKYPKDGNKNALSACNRLWKVAGANRNVGDGAWRSNMKAAKKLLDEWNAPEALKSVDSLSSCSVVVKIIKDYREKDFQENPYKSHQANTLQRIIENAKQKAH